MILPAFALWDFCAPICRPPVWEKPYLLCYKACRCLYQVDLSQNIMQVWFVLFPYLRPTWLHKALRLFIVEQSNLNIASEVRDVHSGLLLSWDQQYLCIKEEYDFDWQLFVQGCKLDKVQHCSNTAQGISPHKYPECCQELPIKLCSSQRIMQQMLQATGGILDNLYKAPPAWIQVAGSAALYKWTLKAILGIYNNSPSMHIPMSRNKNAQNQCSAVVQESEQTSSKDYYDAHLTAVSDCCPISMIAISAHWWTFAATCTLNTLEGVWPPYKSSVDCSGVRKVFHWYRGTYTGRLLIAIWKSFLGWKFALCCTVLCLHLTLLQASSIRACLRPYCMQFPITGLDHFLDNETIVDQDLVAWVSMGILHVPRAEVICWLLLCMCRILRLNADAESTRFINLDSEAQPQLIGDMRRGSICGSCHLYLMCNVSRYLLLDKDIRECRFPSWWVTSHMQLLELGPCPCPCWPYIIGPDLQDVPLISNIGSEFQLKPINYFNALASLDVTDNLDFKACAPRHGSGQFDYTWNAEGWLYHRWPSMGIIQFNKIKYINAVRRTSRGIWITSLPQAHLIRICHWQG